MRLHHLLWSSFHLVTVYFTRRLNFKLKAFHCMQHLAHRWLPWLRRAGHCTWEIDGFMPCTFGQYAAGSSSHGGTMTPVHLCVFFIGESLTDRKHSFKHRFLHLWRSGQDMLYPLSTRYVVYYTARFIISLRPQHRSSFSFYLQVDFTWVLSHLL